MGLFSDRLKMAMQQANMTSAQLAKQTGIGRSSISQWLSNKYVAKYDKVAKLAFVLKVDPDWLLGTTDTLQAPVAPAEVTPQPTPAVAPEVTALWEQLDEKQRAKWLKKGQRLLQKAAAPATKRKAKKKKKSKKHKG